MQVILIGMNHLTAPLEVRERLCLSQEEEEVLLKDLIRNSPVREVLHLSTCNRVEIAAAAEDGEGARKTLENLFLHRGALSFSDLKAYCYTYQDEKAVRHLFRVASSLDSLVMGEPQILGQVKDAYRRATEIKTVGVVLNKLLHRSFHTAKRVRTETALGENPLSVSNAAVQLAKKIFGELEGKTILLVGAGEMSELAARQLIKYGAGRIIVANRTYSRAVELAEKFAGRAVGFDNLDEVLSEADIVITSTGAPGYVITAAMISRAARRRANRFLFLIDIAVPRDIEPEAGELENVFLYNIDNLQEVVDENFQRRQGEARRAETIIEEEVRNFQAWLNSLQAVPTINALIAKMERIAQEEIKKRLAGQNGWDDTRRQEVSSLVLSVVNKIIHDPLVTMKEATQEKEGELYIAAVRRLFKLDEG